MTETIEIGLNRPNIFLTFLCVDSDQFFFSPFFSFRVFWFLFHQSSKCLSTALHRSSYLWVFFRRFRVPSRHNSKSEKWMDGWEILLRQISEFSNCFLKFQNVFVFDRQRILECSLRGKGPLVPVEFQNETCFNR